MPVADATASSTVVPLRGLVGQLPAHLAATGIVGDPETPILAVTCDSRRVRPGSMFVAVCQPGYRSDGHDHVPDAVSRGAAAVVVAREVEVPAGVARVITPRPADALGWLAGAHLGHPSHHLRVCAVTGTDGKTTTASMLHWMLTATGDRAGLVSTVASGVGRGLRANRTRNSTPQACELQSLLAEVRTRGGRYAVVEATSQGLDHRRLAGVRVAVAIVTRITHDHLDHHRTFAAYREAKAGLLDALGPGGRPGPAGLAVLADTDPSTPLLAQRANRAGARVLTFGFSRGADLAIQTFTPTAWGSRSRLATPWGEVGLDLPLPGRFNVANAAAALAAGGHLGLDLAAGAASLAGHPGIPGRLERVIAGQPFKVVVDYAHTPDALHEVLTELRARTTGRLFLVLGSSGHRDVVKRPMLGAVAGTWADWVAITDADPRSEDPGRIRGQIAAGAISAGLTAGRDLFDYDDRSRAIAVAIGQAGPADLVLIAGKGHERTRELHDRTLDWSDVAQARMALRTRGWAGPDRLSSWNRTSLPPARPAGQPGG